ncbi:MAG: hypothetical protein [Caudoviricetes sp.]|nr:MAG: hypothetical protein [Caudoviricetes sp.]
MKTFGAQIKVKFDNDMTGTFESDGEYLSFHTPEYGHAWNISIRNFVVNPDEAIHESFADEFIDHEFDFEEFVSLIRILEKLVLV